MQLFRALGGVLLATGRVAAEGHAACETLTCDAGATEFCATTPGQLHCFPCFPCVATSPEGSSRCWTMCR